MAKKIKEVAYQVLLNAKKPMHISEITEHVRKKVSIKSSTPKNSVNLALQRHKKVKRVGRGTFTIIN